jgi:hypothetical protein
VFELKTYSNGKSAVSEEDAFLYKWLTVAMFVVAALLVAGVAALVIAAL